MNLLIVYALIFIVIFTILGIKFKFKNTRYLKSVIITFLIIFAGIIVGLIPTNIGKSGDNAFYIYNIYKTIRVYGNGKADLSNINKDVKKIVVHSGIEKIESCNFKNLEYVKLADSIVSIGDYAFNGCTKLKNIQLSNNLKYIGFDAFYNCKSIDDIELPKSIEKIYAGAFSFTNISKINIPDNALINVYDNTYSYARAWEQNTYTFYGCSNLREINISENNKNYINVDGVIYNNDKTIIECYPAGKEDKEYVIPNTVTNVEQYYTFAYCNNLRKITISNIELINQYFIYECKNMETIVIEDGVKEILAGAIQKCPNLSEVYINGSTNISDYDSNRDDFLFIKDRDSEEITIYCQENSNAQKYAQNHNYKYVIIEK